MLDIFGLLSHYVVLLGPWVVVLSSLATALSTYPKTSGIARYIKQALNVFSVLTHSDSPGTLKAPFVQSESPAAR